MPAPQGPRGGHGPRSFERPKNFKAGFSRLLKYLDRSKLLAALVIFLLLISTSAMLAGSYALKPLINKYIAPGDFRGLATALFVLGCIYLFGVLAAYLQSRLTIRLAQRTTNIIRRDLFDKMQGLPLRFFDTHTHGELMSRYTNDVDNVQLMFEQSLTQLISSGLTFAGSVAMMILLSPLLFVFTAAVLALMIFMSGKIGAKSRTYFQKQQALLGQLNGNIEEAIGGLKEVKVFNHEEAMKQKFSGINEEFRGAATKANFYAGVIMPIMGNLNNIVYAGTAVFGGMLTIAGRFDIGSLAAFLQYSRHIGMPINQITAQVNNILAAIAGAERVFDVMDREPEVDEGDVTLVAVKGDGAGGMTTLRPNETADLWFWNVPKNGAGDGAERIPLRGDVRFRDVDFSYDGKQPVLKDLSLHARPGHTIAFVGSTGAGKTTITNLLNRFYDIDSGAITYDGIDVRRIRKDDLRRSLGMVLQDTHLFTGTVMENIRYGRLDATDEECVDAAKAASADSFIKRLPEGYATVISGDGANLSQGQRQLLAIARAYTASPPVLILDEATSSIDTRTERHIARGMAALFEGRTAFVIAHRLSTVRRADAIAVLEHGEIIEFGDHASLLQAEGRYFRLCTGQTELD
ncbi:MAG: ABC transporter ATP-binding protein [Acidobacteriota bacterium]|nr:ABC transporter ATP-binding protein [Acidobacteriota bacterium]